MKGVRIMVCIEEMHDAIIRSISVSFDDSAASFDIDYYKSKDDKNRTPITIKFKDVYAFASMLDLKKIKSNSWAGNINYWVSGDEKSPFYFYLSDGCISVLAASIEIDERRVLI
jgi:hypothetical protein